MYMLIQQACLGEDHPHPHPGRVRTCLGGSDTAFSGGSWGQNIQGSLENPELDYRHLPRSASAGQGKDEGQCTSVSLRECFQGRKNMLRNLAREREAGTGVHSQTPFRECRRNRRM